MGLPFQNIGLSPIQYKVGLTVMFQCILSQPTKLLRAICCTCI